jgi:hypothetical protein
MWRGKASVYFHHGNHTSAPHNGLRHRMQSVFSPAARRRSLRSWEQVNAGTVS